MRSIDNTIFARRSDETPGAFDILDADSGLPVTRLDATAYPVGSSLSCRHEHPEGITLSAADVARLGVEIEDGKPAGFALTAYKLEFSTFTGDADTTGYNGWGCRPVGPCDNQFGSAAEAEAYIAAHHKEPDASGVDAVFHAVAADDLR